MGQILKFPELFRAKFKTAARDAQGDEVCGVLVGQSHVVMSNVEELRMITNIAPDKAAGFMMDPVDFLYAIEDTQLFTAAFSKHYLGIIHSHCYDRPYPSIADWFGADDKRLYHGVYVIYSVLHEQFKCFNWNGNEFTKMELLF